MPNGQRDSWSRVEIIAKATAGILIPIILLVLGHWFTSQQKEADISQRNADRIPQFIKHLASENPKERLIAIHVLRHLGDIGEFPSELVTPLAIIAESDNLEIAGAAVTVLRAAGESPKQSRDFVVLSELLAPMMIHFDRTKEAFQRWTSKNLHLESEIIRKGNQFIRDLLISKAHLIPQDLQKDASRLVVHYDAWLEEYELIRGGLEPDLETPFVFVGPKGFPFPTDAEESFRKRYEDLQNTLGGAK